MTLHTGDLAVERLLAEARRRTGLDDFGPQHFLLPLRTLVASMTGEAQLSPVGQLRQSERLINALANRLRKAELMHRHPEIAEQTVSVAAAIVGLPRTGSTMLHRLLAATPQLTATYWWETIFPLPLPSEQARESHVRRSKAETLSAQISASAKDFDAIHPLDASAHDEELPLLEQTFMSTLPESMMYLPSYGAWLAQADPEQAYQELIDYLKILQWQGGRGGQKWVLKAPSHLQFVPTVLRLFPDAVIVMTHREISPLMGSWYSMTEALRRADSDAELSHDQAAHWTRRWRDSLKVLVEARKHSEARFLDIDYRTLLQHPRQAAEMVFNRAGMVVTEADQKALERWIETNPRDKRPTHKYALEDYGVTSEMLASEFAFYELPTKTTIST